MTDKIAAADKFEQHYRQQLSALMDGALPPDEARFLLRRLQHDSELAQCLDRWHMAGDALRGEAQSIVCADFAQRVAVMVASEPALSPAVANVVRANRVGLRWAGGAALAASVALVALFVGRQPAAPDSLQTPSTIAEASALSDAGNTAVMTNGPATPDSAMAAVRPPEFAGEPTPAPAIATASTPVRNSIRRGNRSQSQRATIRTAARSEQPMVAAAANSQTGNAAASNMFDTPPISRPWPSAVFPQAPGTGSFNVDYGNASSPTFYPFAPRLPDEQPRDGDEAQPIDDAPLP